MELNNFFCKIFIDTDSHFDYLYQAIVEMVSGESYNRSNIKNETFDLSLIKNDDFNVQKRLEFPDGFLFSRYYLEVEPNNNFEPHNYLASISLLIESLWANDFNVVAACDFEELLPRKGGYNHKL